jgi:hypothetical protein
MICLKKRQFVNKKNTLVQTIVPRSHCPHKVLMAGNLHLPPPLGTNGLSEHLGMVEIHTPMLLQHHTYG